MSLELKLSIKKHPSKDAEAQYDDLVGIDDHKSALLSFLELTLNPEKITQWLKTHHSKGLPYLDRLNLSAPLIILSGEVGCGKTALASSIATPLGKLLDTRILTLEPPTNLRGSGLVGEISKRITDTFDNAKASLSSSPSGQGILILDEADDIATARSQMQAHHEDRAGLNALIKQLDKLKEDKIKLAVILITNRPEVVDPAVRRRASLELVFSRPDVIQLEALFNRILAGTNPTKSEISSLVDASKSKSIPFSFSDLTNKVAKAAILECLRSDKKLTAGELLAAVRHATPSPLLSESTNG